VTTFLYYTPMSWPHLQERAPAFPHSNALFDPAQGVALYRESLDLFRAAEESGFDWLGIGEEHMNAYGVVPNPCLVAATLAPLTRHAKLCIMGNPLPLLNPIRVAEEYAMVDMLSGGRLVAGFPRGVPQNYAAYGVSPDQSRERLAEAVDLVIAAWTRRGPFDWAGMHYQFQNVTIWPQPVALPEIILSAKSPESLALALHHKAMIAELYVKNRSVMTHFQTNVAAYRAQAVQAGWAAAADRFLISVPCIIAATAAAAQDRARRAAEYAWTYISGSFEAGKAQVRDSYYRSVGHLLAPQRETLEDRIGYGGLICGDPVAVSDQIHALTEATGAGVIGLQMQWGNLPGAFVRESLDLFASQVRPHIQ
jgi:alkanesulfonate monooxygenase SsuD/methylene tetrahydromethanopterin reductase-like flavin-dependent oxidoreductase (luciferase family)